MKKLSYFFASLTLGVLLSCSSQKVVPQANSEKDFTFLVSANRYLDLEPCGCSLNPLGGIAREWNYLAEERAKDPSLLYFVAGTSFVREHGRFDPENKAQYSVMAKFAADAFGKFKVTALSPTDEDLYLGEEALKELSRSSQVPFISTNLYSTKTKAPIFQTHLETTHKGVPLLILGASANSERGRSKKYKAEPIVKTLQTFFKNRPRKVGEWVVLLTNATRKERSEIVDKLPEVNWIIGGTNDEVPGSIQQFTGNQMYVNPQGNGKSMYRVSVKVGAPQSKFYNPSMGEAHARTRTRWQALLNDPKNTEDKEAKKGMQEFLVRSASVPSSASPGITEYSYERTEIGPNYDTPTNPMNKLIVELRESVRGLAGH